MTTNAWRKLAVIAVLGVLFAGGCSSAKDSAAPSTAGRGEAVAPGDPLSGGGTDQFNSSKDQGAANPPLESTGNSVGVLADRSLIYTGSITVRVDDVKKAIEQLRGKLPTGAFVSSEKSNADPAQAQAWITVRVPAKDYQRFFEDMAGLGKELDRSSNVQDVTEAVIDLDSRIASAKLSLESAQRLYAQAKTFQDLSQQDKEVGQRMADLAALEAKKRQLDSLIALSTLTVGLVGPHTEVVEEEEPSLGFLGGLKHGWKAFLDAADAGLVALGFLVPFLSALVVLLLLIVGIRRFRRRQTPPPSTSD